MALRDNLTAWWDFDETSGVRADAVGENDLTDYNSPGYIEGKKGNAVDFEKSTTPNAYLRRNNTADIEPGTGDYSLAIGFICESLGGVRGIISKDGPGTGYTLYSNGSDLGYNHQGIGGPSLSGALTTATWYHVVLTYNATTDELKIYLDGAYAQTATVGFNTNTATLSIGSYNNTSEYGHDGAVDFAAFWKGRVLSADDVAALYAEGAWMNFADTAETPPAEYCIRGKVWLKGAPVDGATVRVIEQESGMVAGSATTDETGEYLIVELEEGQLYHVCVEYETLTQAYSARSVWNVAPWVYEE